MTLDEARTILCDMLTEDGSGKEQLRDMRHSMKVRKHRGGLGESMATASTVRTQAELNVYFGEPVTVDDLAIFDERNGWVTHYVLDANGQCIGMSDGRLPAFTADEIEAIRVWRYADAFMDGVEAAAKLCDKESQASRLESIAGEAYYRIIPAEMAQLIRSIQPPDDRSPPNHSAD